MTRCKNSGVQRTRKTATAIARGEGVSIAETKSYGRIQGILLQVQGKIPF